MSIPTDSYAHVAACEWAKKCGLGACVAQIVGGHSAVLARGDAVTERAARINFFADGWIVVHRDSPDGGEVMPYDYSDPASVVFAAIAWLLGITPDAASGIYLRQMEVHY